MWPYPIMCKISRVSPDDKSGAGVLRQSDGMFNGKECIVPSLQANRVSMPPGSRTQPNQQYSKDVLLTNPPRGTVQQRWDTLKETIHSTIQNTFRRKWNKTLDWIKASANELNMTIRVKYVALVEHKHQHIHTTLQDFCSQRQCTEDSQTLCEWLLAQDAWKHMVINWHLWHSKNIWRNQIISPTKYKTALLESWVVEIISDTNKQM